MQTLYYSLFLLAVGALVGGAIGWHVHRYFVGWINRNDVQNWNYTK